MLCIYYLLHFKKDGLKIQALIDSDNEVNKMAPAYAAKLGLKIEPTNIKGQKINNSTFKMFDIVLASF